MPLPKAFKCLENIYANDSPEVSNFTAKFAIETMYR